jgi:uncharacterized membrane-anchored protein YhcB (DUF1043 family)
MKIYATTLTQKLIILLLMMVSMSTFFVGTWSYWSGSKALEKQFLKSFEWVALSKAQSIKRYLVGEMIRADDFSADVSLQQLLAKYTVAQISDVELSQKLTELLQTKAKTLADSDDIYETLVLDAKGKVLGSTHPELAQSHQFSADFINRALKKNAVGDVYKHPSTGEVGFLVASPVQLGSASELGIAIIVNRISTKDLDIIASRGVEEFGKSGEFYLVNKDGYRITKSRFNQKGSLEEQINTEIVRAFRDKEQSYSGSYQDYRDIKVIGASEFKIISEADNVGWLFIAEMDISEVHSLAVDLSKEIMIFGIGTVLVALVVGVIVGRMISAPIRNSVQEFLTTSSEISVTTEQHERTAAQQAAAVSETSATMDELGRSAQQSIFQAESANSTAKQAVINAKTGARAMDEMLTSMEELSRRVDNIGAQILRLSDQTSQIGHVTEAVKDIANQTNLLALNAAVEATRAGEHGKGFTVVSQEIRKLAEQSKKSAERISDLVDTIQKGTNATVLATEAGTQTTKLSGEQVKYAKQSFDVLLDSVNNIAEVLQQIALTAKQQSNATNQVVEAMSMINTGAQETANGINQNKEAIQKLNRAAKTLQNVI